MAVSPDDAGADERWRTRQRTALVARRGQGEGSIYQRQDGRWTAALSLGGGRQQLFYGKTRREVQIQLTAALRARDQGLAVTASRQRLDSYLEERLTTIRPTVRTSTWLGRVPALL